MPRRCLCLLQSYYIVDLVFKRKKICVWEGVHTCCDARWAEDSLWESVLLSLCCLGIEFRSSGLVANALIG